MSVYLFPGQDSQTKGTGEALFKRYPETVANSYEILGHYQKIHKEQQKVRYVTGHSLGESNTLLAAGVFDFETGLKLFKKRRKLMSQTTCFGMAAIVGLTADKITSILGEENLLEVSIPNYNSHTQVVISGPQNATAITQPIFEKAGTALFVPLKITGAFHSLYMKSAQQRFKAFLNQFQFNRTNISVIANIDKKPYQHHKTSFRLIEQITVPVRWLAQGETEFVEDWTWQYLNSLSTSH